MKKILTALFFIFLIQPASFGLNFGMYKPEEDYGLIDGLKFNFSKQDRLEGKQLIQLKTEDSKEKARMEKEKKAYEANKDQKADDEYQMFKFMLDDTIPF